MFDKLEHFGKTLQQILLRSLVAPERQLRWVIIANPTAGGFTILNRWSRHQKDLSLIAGQASHLPLRNPASRPADICQNYTDSTNGNLTSCGLIPTTRPGHAHTIVQSLLDEAETSDPNNFYLIIMSGGDGTSLDALTALAGAPQKMRGRFAILRLPLGTGNDGADSRSLREALSLLLKPTKLVFRPAVQLKTANRAMPPFLAFNILSLGIDAFISDLTNKLKKYLPGDSYRLMVEFSTLFYEVFYPPAPMELVVYRDNTETRLYEKLLLIAMGASGNRTYGSNKQILPDYRNICAIYKMVLIRKLALKSGVLKGKHINFPEARLFKGERLEISYNRPIIAQMDGETVRLLPEDFPASIQLTEPCNPQLVLI